MIEFNTSDYNGSKGVTLEEGTYAVTLSEARIYKNEKYQSEEQITQIDLVWDTGEIYENEDGKDTPGLITDSFLTLSFNEKAKLTARLKAILGKEFDLKNAKVGMQIEGHDNVSTLTHRTEGKAKIAEFTVNGESLFGKTAMVGVIINDAGYNRVTSVSAPMKQSGARKAASAPAAPL